MEKKRVMISVFAAIALLLFLYAGLYIYSLYQLETRGFNIVKVTAVGNESIILDGEVGIYNGGLIGVSVNDITYKISAESSGEELSSGIISGKKVPAKETVILPFISEIDMVSISKLGLNLLLSKEVFVVIEGDISAGIAGIKIPYKQRIDIKPYIKDLFEEKAKEVTGKVMDFVSGLFG